MKGKQLLLLLLLAALAGGAWYFLGERNRGAWSESDGGGGKVVEFPINDVAHLKIKDSAGEVNLVKKADVWTVQERADYPASFEKVGGLLRKLWELKTVQEVKVGASQLPRLELEEPGKGDKTGTLIEFMGSEDKTLAGLLLGKKHVRKPEGGADMGFGGVPTGRYVKAIGKPKVSLVSDPLDDAEAKPENWLLKDFIKIDGAKSITVAGPTDAHKWTVTRENAGAEWQLAAAKPDEKMDSGKTFAFGTILSAPTFNDVLPPDAKPGETGLDQPTAVTIETFDGFRYALKIGKAEGPSVPLRVDVNANLAKERPAGAEEKEDDKKKLDDEFAAKRKQLEEKLAREQKFAGRTYLVEKMAVDPLLQERAALLAQKPAEPAPADAPAPAAPASATTPPIPVPAAANPPMPAAAPAPSGSAGPRAPTAPTAPPAAAEPPAAVPPMPAAPAPTPSTPPVPPAGPATPAPTAPIPPAAPAAPPQP